ncbi:MAG: LytTR family DNA-binding domain-containing protein [Bacteroidota bacterium]
MNKRYYPPPATGLNGLLYSIAFGAFIGFFLWFFEPFDLDSDGYSTGEILFFGVISFFVFFAFHVVVPLILPGLFREKGWTIWSQMLFYLIVLLAIATLNGLYINYLNDLDFSWRNYGFIIIRTIVLGVIPIFMFVLLFYYWKNQASTSQAAAISRLLSQKDTAAVSEKVVIKTDIKNETFQLSLEDFLFAKADGNYTQITTLSQDKQIYRLNLSAFTQQLTNFDHLLRCHRSYVVNGKHIIKVTGNAQGLKLWLTGCEDFIPVSRKYIPEIKSYLNQSA